MALLWLDLETTGLNPAADRILEVAWHLTDNKLENLDLGSTWHSVVEQGSFGLGYAKARMNEYVTNMHTETGLLHELETNDDTLSLKEIEQTILGDIEYHEGPDNTSPRPWYLAGASVHFDLGFIRSWMPLLAAKLSHRVYDTSTLKAFFSSLGIEHPVVNSGQHRAANDVDETLAVARFYRQWVIEAVQNAEPGSSTWPLVGVIQ